MNAWYVAVDVIREAIARRYVYVMLAMIALGLGILLFALDLDVVNGAISASKLFGKDFGGSGSVSIREAMNEVFTVLLSVVFYGGIFYGTLATADIAPKLLSPGRIEFLLSLPIQRWQLVVGTYLGVIILASCGILLAVGGVTGILWFKTGYSTWAPFIGALCALIGFTAVYSVSLFMASVARSSSMSSAAAIFIFILCLATSDRVAILSLFQNGPVKTILSICISPLPRLLALGDVGSDLLAGKIIDFGQAFSLVGGTLLFAGAFVTAATFVVHERDY